MAVRENTMFAKRAAKLFSVPRTTLQRFASCDQPPERGNLCQIRKTSHS